MSNVKRLYRSEDQKMLAGVAGGIAEYFNIDPTLVRLGFALSSVIWGTGTIVYVIMWLIVPTKSQLGSKPNETLNDNVSEMKNTAKQAGEFVKEKVEGLNKKDE